jgi:cobyrinic acid a,c-diamide synthase
MTPGLVIAAPRSGSGKTLATLGLLAALTARGLTVAPAKTGPDYIDGAFLARAARRPVTNLDPWAMAPDRLRAIAARHAESADLILAEGVMGLFDGAADGTGSTGDLAATLGLPVLLVIDCERQSQSVAPLVMGFANWRQQVRVAGVLLNRVASPRHEMMLRTALAETGLPVVGALPRSPDLAIPSRHLGLTLPEEVEGIDAILNRARDLVATHCDLDAILALATPLAPPSAAAARLPPLGQHVAIARDRAFSFLYTHWLDDWQAAGATLSFFSPLSGDPIPETADAVLLTGGYPELHPPGEPFFQTLKKAHDRGALIYGECGGFMVLGRALTDARCVTSAMSGLLPLETRIDQPRRVLGYRRLIHQSPLPWPKALTGHEFHYSSAHLSPAVEPLFSATDALGTPLPPMGMRIGRVMGSYAHIIDRAIDRG